MNGASVPTAEAFRLGCFRVEIVDAGSERYRHFTVRVLRLDDAEHDRLDLDECELDELIKALTTARALVDHRHGSVSVGEMLSRVLLDSDIPTHTDDDLIRSMNRMACEPPANSGTRQGGVA